MSISRVVVAGGGLAGLRTIEALRARRYGGAVTLVGAEPHAPYDRPPLSKQLLAGVVDDTTLDADFAALGVDLRLGETAMGLADGVLLTDCGAYPFDRLVVATGAVPVALPGDGAQRFLRTIDDARSLRDLLRPGLRLAVVGAGLDRRGACHRRGGARLPGHRGRGGAGAAGGRDRRRGGRADDSAGTRRPGWTCGWARPWSPCRRAGLCWPAARGWRRTRS